MDIRASLDTRPEKIGRKIRDAEVSKTPYMLIIGEKEVEQNLLSVRRHGQGDKGQLNMEEFKKLLKNEISQ
jgi:threonyl-tRNA synthetase